MRLFFSRILPLAFITVLAAVVLFKKATSPRIMIIHSYQTDYVWVKDVDNGLLRVLSARSDVNIRRHYMDLKNHQSEDFRRTAARTALQAIDLWRPDVLILVDDLAQKLVGMEYLDDPNISIVFSGVNGAPEAYGYHKAKNVTGILERKPLPALRETLMLLADMRGIEGGNGAKVTFIGDQSASISREIPYYSTIDWSPLVWLPERRADTFEEWKKAVKLANEDGDLILLTNYRRIHRTVGGDLVPPKEVMSWTEANSEIPVLGMNYFNVADGAMMAVALSPYEQGSVAADRALKVVDGAKASSIPITQTKQFVVAQNKTATEKRGLPIPAIYQAFASATNNFLE